MDNFEEEWDCDVEGHEFVAEGNPEWETDETIKVEGRCVYCGKSLREIWIYSCTLENS